MMTMIFYFVKILVVRSFFKKYFFEKTFATYQLGRIDFSF